MVTKEFDFLVRDNSPIMPKVSTFLKKRGGKCALLGWSWWDFESLWRTAQERSPLLKACQDTHRTALLRFLFFHLPQQTVSSRLRDHTGSGKTLSTGDCIWNEWKNMGEGEDHSADVNFSKHFRNLWTYDDESKKTDLLQTGRKLTCVNFLNGSVEPRDWVSWEKLFSGKSLPVKPSEDKM